MADPTDALDAAWGQSAQTAAPTADPLESAWGAEPASDTTLTPTPPINISQDNDTGSLQPAPVHLGKPGEVTSEDPTTYQLSQPETDRAVRVSTLFGQTFLQDSDTKAVKQRFAKQTGLPFDVVSENFPELQKSWAASKFDAVKWMQNNEHLATLVLDHPNLAPLVERDQQLSYVHQALNFALDHDFNMFVATHPGMSDYDEAKKAFASDIALRNLPKKQTFLQDEQAKSLESGWTILGEGHLGGGFPVPSRAIVPFKRFGEMWDQMKISKGNYDLMRRRDNGEDTYDFENQLNDLKLQSVQRDYNEGPVEQLFTDGMQAAASSAYPLKEAGVLAGVAGAGAGAGVLAVTKSPALAGEAALDAAAMFGKAGAVYGTFQMESGSAYGDMLDHGIDERHAAVAAKIYGTLAAGIEFASWGPMFKALGPVGSLIEEGSTEAFSKALMKNQGFKSYVKAQLAEGAAEGGEEFLQDATQQAVEYFARAHEVGFDKAGRMSGVDLGQSLEAGVKGTTGGLFLGAAHSTVHMATRGIFRDKALESRNVVQILNGLEQSETTLADPEAVAEMVQHLAPGLKAVHIDAGAYVRLHQSENIDPATAADQLLGEGGADKLKDAVATGGKLEVPLSAYLDWKQRVKVEGGAAMKSALVDHTTVDAALPTPAAIDEKAMKKAVDELVSSFEKGEESEPETAGEAKWLDAAERQLALVPGEDVKKARDKMQLQRAVMRVWADRFGQDADSLFADQSIQVEAGNNPTAREVLTARSTSIELDRAEELYRDENTGLPNELAFAESKPPPNRPKVAHLSVEGIKWMNDSVNHSRADLLYRSVAQALHSIGQDAYKVGGDFAFYTKGDENAAAVLEKVKEALPNELRGFALTMATGDTLEAASYKNAAETKRQVAAGTRANPRPVLLDKDGKAIPDAEGEEQVQFPEKPKGLGAVDPAAIPFAETKATPALAPELRSDATKLTPADYFNKAYVDPDTGVWTAKGWAAIPRKKHIASLDLSGLRKVNENHGKQYGDEMLFLMGKMAKKLGGETFDFAHLHGDEFAAQSDDVKALEGFVEHLRAQLDLLSVPYEESETGELTHLPIQFHHGYSDDAKLETADADLNDRKRRLKKARQAGLERRRGEPPRSRAVSRSEVGGAGERNGPAHSASSSDASEEVTNELVGEASGATRAGDARSPQQGAGVGADHGRSVPDGSVAGLAGTVRSDLAGPSQLDIRAAAKDNDYAAAKALIARARSNKTAYQDWFRWAVEKKGQGERPLVSWAVESTMARYGVVDPINGFSGDESGRDMAARKLKTDHRKGGDLDARQAREAGIGLTGNAADFKKNQKTGGKMVFQSPGPNTLFYQFPTPEQSIENMRAQRVFNDMALEHGATVVNSTDLLLEQLKKSETTQGDMFVVVTNRGEREFGTTEEARDFIKENDVVNDVAGGDRVIYGVYVTTQTTQPRPTSLQGHQAITHHDRPRVLGDDTEAPRLWASERQPPGSFVSSDKGPAATIPESKNLPDQAALEGATKHGGLGSILKVIKVEDHGYTGTVKFKQLPHGPVWYSAVDRAVGQAKQEKNTAAAWLSVIEKSSGVKKEELDFMGLREWLKEQKGSVTRADIQKFIDAHKVEVTEQELAPSPNGAVNGDVAQYENYTLGGHAPGTYKELLFHAPGTTADAYQAPHFGQDGKGLLAHARISEHTTKDGKPLLFVEEIQSDLHQAAREKGYERRTDKPKQLLEKRHAAGDAFMSVARDAGLADGPARQIARDMREDYADGKMDGKQLGAVEGVSAEGLKAIDAAGRKLREADLAWRAEESKAPTGSNRRANGDGAKRVPDAPFKTTWDEMVAKRLIRYAAEKGYEKIGWTTGEQQAARYDLAKRVGEIRYNPETKDFHVLDHEGDNIQGVPGTVEPKDLAGIIGKEAAAKLLAARMDGEYHSLKGPDMKLGGEGMKTAYDRRIPSVFEKLVKKYGGEVSKEKLATEGRKYHVGEREHDGWPVVDPGGDIVHRGFVTREAAEGEAAQSNFRHGKNGANSSPDAWTVTLPEELRKAVLREGMPLFSKGRKEGEGPRGYTEIFNEGMQRLFKVVLNPNADQSTFLHESAHIFLELMTTLAQRQDAPERLKEDYARALEYLGAKGPEDLVVKSSAEDDAARVRHEKWARSFEKYLLEGKAPARGLVRMFERFRLWLSQVYRDPRALKVDLNDNIRGVFDRMLATDKEIESYRRAMGLDGPPLASDVFKHPDDYEAYLESRVQLTAEATRRVDLAATKDKLREQEAWWRDELKNEQAAAEEEYEKLPARRVQQTLAGKGELWGRGDTNYIELDKSLVTTAVGKQLAKKFRTTQNEERAVDPAEVADFFGYPSGDAMLKDVLDLEQKDKWVKDRADEAMATKHPDVINDRTKLREKVEQGLHGEATEAYLLKEWAALKLKAGKPGQSIWQQQETPMEAIIRAAREYVGRRAIGKIDVGGALRSEQRAADMATKAAARGNFAKALAHKQQQLLNFYVWRELSKAKDEREKFLDLASELSGDKARARLGKASPVYRDGADTLLEAIGLKQPSDHAAAGVDDIVRQMEADGQVIGIDEDALNNIIVKPRGYKDLTVAEMRVVRDTLSSIVAAARGVTTVLMDGKRIDKEEVVQQIVDTGNRYLPLIPAGNDPGAETVWERAKDIWQSADGSMLKQETMVHWLGNNDIHSPIFRALVLPLQDAKHKEVELMRGPVKLIIDAFDKMPSKIAARQSERIDGKALFPGHTDKLAAPARRWQILMLLLNSGNESNLMRLTEGRNITEQQIRDAAVKVGITKEEYDWVQSVWDACEALKKPAFDLEERDSGIRPEEIEARAFQTPFGMYKGGYFPAVYDRRGKTDVGEKQNMAQFQDPTYTPTGTARGHLKKRADVFSDVISLAPQSIYRHLAQVSHDIAFREPIRSVAQLLTDDRVKDMLTKRLGDARARTFIQWVKDVGQMRGIEGATHVPAFLALMQGLRAGMTFAVLGGSIQNALEDYATGLSTAAMGSELQSKHLVAGIADVRGGLGRDAIARAESQSGELRARHGQQSRELLSEINKLISKSPLARGPLRFLKDHAFGMQEQTDKVVSSAIWLGAQRQAIANGENANDAVVFADKIVRQLLPSHHAVDTAALLRDRGFVGASLIFFRFWSTAFNIGRRDGPSLMSDLATPKRAGEWLGYALALNLLGSMVRGQGPDPGEPWDQWAMRKLLTGQLSKYPFIGELAEFGWSVGPFGTKRHEPRNNGLAGMATGIYDLATKAANGDKDADERLEATLKGMGLLTGQPVGQPLRTGMYGYRLGTGKVTARGAGDVIGGAVYGQGAHQAVNIPTLVQDFISAGWGGVVEHPGPR